ncbi:hypothetical protein SISNIDRAFT_468507 [Sistotremastrum niveocremeum HHB9708]|uniref:Uncharacterized protein n=1 Tax=Sistotremastrum niveocremeum HHB9708 TaxID=1314777 RepID=A0A164RBZ6_9AGAM|nr:hypothetical protein SISNIDRAFT_468507 [Sistotremastrum niveocremeum HHB9708]
MSPRQSAPGNTKRISRVASSQMSSGLEDGTRGLHVSDSVLEFDPYTQITFVPGLILIAEVQMYLLAPHLFNVLINTCQAERERRREIEAASAAKRKEALDKLTLLVKQCSADSDRQSIKCTADAAARAMVIIRSREEELKAHVRAYIHSARLKEELQAQKEESEAWKQIAIEFLNDNATYPQDEEYWKSVVIGRNTDRDAPDAFETSFNV